jgi:hypothetical protein
LKGRPGRILELAETPLVWIGYEGQTLGFQDAIDLAGFGQVSGDLIVRDQKLRIDELTVQTRFQEGVVMVAVGKIDLPEEPAITMVYEAVRVPEGAPKPVHEFLFTNRDSMRDTMPDPAAHVCYAVPEST